MLITQAMLAEVAAHASASPRRRRNRNFHAHESAPCSRMLNALQPDSYVQPHCHLDTSKDESIIALGGRFGVVMFDAFGRVVSHHVIAPGGDAVGIDIAHSTIHTIIALEPDSVFFEAKAGPYVPVSAAEKAPWAPPEGAPECGAFLARMHALFEAGH